MKQQAERGTPPAIPLLAVHLRPAVSVVQVIARAPPQTKRARSSRRSEQWRRASHGYNSAHEEGEESPAMSANRARRAALFVVVLFLAGWGRVEPADASATGDQAVIVVLRDGTHAPTVAAEHAAAHAFAVSHVYEHALSGYAAHVPAQRLSLIASDPRVLFISRDNEVSATDTQTLPTGIDRIQGDQSSQHSGSGSGSSVGVAVAIIDTGSGPHSDLNVVGGTNCSTGHGFADGNGHGTHVAGTVAARN